MKLLAFLLGVGPLLADALEERVAKDPIRFHCPVEIADTGIETFRVDETGRQGGFPDTFDHRCERLSCESIDKVGSARIDIHSPRGNTYSRETCSQKQGINLSAN